MRTLAIQNKWFKAVSSVTCFYTSIQNLKEFAVYEENRERKVFITIRLQIVLCLISAWVYYSPWLHIFPETEVFIYNTIHLLHDDEGDRNEDWFSKE